MWVGVEAIILMAVPTTHGDDVCFGSEARTAMTLVLVLRLRGHGFRIQHLTTRKQG